MSAPVHLLRTPGDSSLETGLLPPLDQDGEKRFPSRRGKRAEIQQGADRQGWTTRLGAAAGHSHPCLSLCCSLSTAGCPTPPPLLQVWVASWNKTQLGLKMSSMQLPGMSTSSHGWQVDRCEGCSCFLPSQFRSCFWERTQHMQGSHIP